MKTMATRLRTSKPRLPPVAGVPVVSSVQWFNVTITSTDTRPADGSASRPSAKAAILRRGGCRVELLALVTALSDRSALGLDTNHEHTDEQRSDARCTA